MMLVDFYFRSSLSFFNFPFVLCYYILGALLFSLIYDFCGVYVCHFLKGNPFVETLSLTFFRTLFKENIPFYPSERIAQALFHSSILLKIKRHLCRKVCKSLELVALLPIATFGTIHWWILQTQYRTALVMGCFHQMNMQCVIEKLPFDWMNALYFLHQVLSSSCVAKKKRCSVSLRRNRPSQFFFFSFYCTPHLSLWTFFCLTPCFQFKLVMEWHGCNPWKRSHLHPLRIPCSRQNFCWFRGLNPSCLMLMMAESYIPRKFAVSISIACLFPLVSSYMLCLRSKWGLFGEWIS